VFAAVALCLGIAPAAGARALRARVFKGACTSFPDYMDPQLSYSGEGWTAMYDTYIPLLTYRHAAGKPGSEVIPGLARSLPQISDGGRTYTLFLHPGLHYSDGERVRASDFRFTVERMFRTNSGGSEFYTDIVGARDFERHHSRHIAGIVTDDRSGRIVIHLKRPRATFSDELALLFVAPVPPTTPMRDQTFNPPPATGPYVITSSQPGFGWTYARNPEWAAANVRRLHGIPSGHVDRIEIFVIRDRLAQLEGVDQGELDWMYEPPVNRGEVEAKAPNGQFRSETGTTTYYFWMNTRKAPFDNLKVRRAVNYAVDPAAIARLSAGRLTPTHQLLPPDIPGYRKFDLYPHDMAKARRLTAEAHPTDREITVWTNSESPNSIAGKYYASVLRKLGFKVRLETVNPDNYFTVIGNLRTPSLDTGFSSWYADYPHPNDFFGPLFATPPLPIYNENLSQIEAPSLSRRVTRLDAEPGPLKELQYAALDRDYMKLAPIVPFGTEALSLLVSGTVDLDKVIWNPTFGADLTSFQFSSKPYVETKTELAP
jgi:peptide/nickel transport system substrate-binding protein